MTDKPDDIPLEFKDWVKAYYVKAGFISSTDELRAAWDAAANARLRRLHVLNAELLEALRGYVNDYSSEDGMYTEKHYVKVFSEVIDRAEGRQ